MEEVTQAEELSEDCMEVRFEEDVVPELVSKKVPYRGQNRSYRQKMKKRYKQTEQQNNQETLHKIGLGLIKMGFW